MRKELSDHIDKGSPFFKDYALLFQKLGREDQTEKLLKEIKELNLADEEAAQLELVTKLKENNVKESVFSFLEHLSKFPGDRVLWIQLAKIYELEQQLVN